MLSNSMDHGLQFYRLIKKCFQYCNRKKYKVYSTYRAKVYLCRRVSVGRHPQTGPDHVECEPAVRCCHVYA